MKKASIFGAILGIILGFAFNYAMRNLWFFTPHFGLILSLTFLAATIISIVTKNDFLYWLIVCFSGTVAIFIGEETRENLTGTVAFLFGWMVATVLRIGLN